MDINFRNTQLYFGDCLNVLKTIPDDSIDLVVTDPPYDIKNTTPGGNSSLCDRIEKQMNDIKKPNLTAGFNILILDELVRVNKNINMYFFCNKAQLPMYIDYFVTQRNCSFDLIKWVKSNTPPTFNNKYLSDTEYVFYARKSGYCNPDNYKDASTLYQSPTNVKDKRLYGHPTPKPLDLVSRLISNSSKPRQTIIDPFMGAGVVGVACDNLNRVFTGIEIDAQFYSTSCNRILTNAPL